MTLPYLPPEIQYQIIESADWIEQATFANVCKSWRAFVQTSRSCLLNRYDSRSWPASGNGPPYLLHKILFYRQGFVRSPRSSGLRYLPCRLRELDDKGVEKEIFPKPEPNLSIFYQDQTILDPENSELFVRTGCVGIGMETSEDTGSHPVPWGDFYGARTKQQDVESFLRYTCRVIEEGTGSRSYLIGYIGEWGLKTWKYFELKTEPEREQDTSDVTLTIWVTAGRLLLSSRGPNLYSWMTKKILFLVEKFIPTEIGTAEVVV